MTAAASSPARELPELERGQAIAVDWPADRYHASTDLVSRSMLETLRESPAMFNRRYNAGFEPRDPSRALTLGTLLHVAVLEPERWSGVLPPEPPRPQGASGKARKGSHERVAYDGWKMMCGLWSKVLRGDLTDEQRVMWSQIRGGVDPIIVSESQFELVSEMAEAVRAHPFARELLADDSGTGYPCANEQTVLWREPTSGVLCRLRIDRLRDFAERGVMAVLDLKSTRDPSPRAFSVSIARYGYHFQAAFYSDAVRALYPDRKVLYGFVAVRSAEPFDVGCYQPAKKDLERGRQQYQKSLVDLLERRQTNNWVAPWQEWCSPIAMPRWAHKDDA